MPGAALQAFCDLALPRACAGCDEKRVALCERCLAELREALATPAFAALPSPCPVGFPTTWSQTPYDGAVAQLLRAFKDSGRSDLAPRLAKLLRSAVAGLAEYDESCLAALRSGRQMLVVPMPSRSTSTRARGREPTVELARLAVRGARPLVLCRALRTSAAGRDQAGLTAQERARNMHGAMRLTAIGRARVPGRFCVVVDDIVTTGSSLAEAHATLLDAGAAGVAAATVAATQRYGG
ncbi:hypothetical protein GCM10011492_32530 [Flexivirga endophytica]|uniref:ComF family protein n=1 Tax=Flexivirga endophytica TaxID=1849103 RepID=A0A916TC39_9MICO|nr:ComF family protein [Flexivirga endophytica]GGB39248.1 hypothetical protein GCM10011492_32530 [Flexivirga endophytica]GHB47179.1 hypothetical protein GCM10008112_14920 [Flexivirga endophytica]